MKIDPVGTEMIHAGRREDTDVKGDFGDYAKKPEKKVLSMHDAKVQGK
jgi:hypothetical protein